MAKQLLRPLVLREATTADQARILALLDEVAGDLYEFAQSSARDFRLGLSQVVVFVADAPAAKQIQPFVRARLASPGPRGLVLFSLPIQDARALARDLGVPSLRPCRGFGVIVVHGGTALSVSGVRQRRSR